jgi:hypothetical protein
MPPTRQPPTTVQIEQLRSGYQYLSHHPRIHERSMSGWRRHFEIPPALAALPGAALRGQAAYEDQGIDEARIESLLGEDPLPGAVVFAEVGDRLFVVKGIDYLDALEAAGRPTWPLVGNDGRPRFPHVMHTLKEGEDLDELVLQLNCRDVAAHRLTRQEMRDLTIWVLKNHTHWADRRIAENIGASANTVIDRRWELIIAGEIEDLEKLQGRDTRWRRAYHKKRIEKAEEKAAKVYRCSFCNRTRAWLHFASWRTKYPAQICLVCVESALENMKDYNTVSIHDESARLSAVHSLELAIRQVSSVIKNLELKRPRKRRRHR